MITIKLVNGKPVVPQNANQIREIPTKTLTNIKQHRPATSSQQCWLDYNSLRIEQARVANGIHELISRRAGKEEIAAMYARIESYRDDLVKLYHDARYTEQHGKAPTQPQPDKPKIEVALLKQQKRSLSDKRCKLQVKIEKGKATNSKNLVKWEEELAIANLEYDNLVQRIKEIEGK